MHAFSSRTGDIIHTFKRNARANVWFRNACFGSILSVLTKSSREVLHELSEVRRSVLGDAAARKRVRECVVWKPLLSVNSIGHYELE